MFGRGLHISFASVKAAAFLSALGGGKRMTCIPSRRDGIESLFFLYLVSSIERYKKLKMKNRTIGIVL